MAALIAEWDRSGLTQLVSAGTADLSAGGAGRTLSVVSAAERGNVLRYSGGAGGASITQIFMWSTASGLLIPSTDERRDVDIELELYDATLGNGYVGVFFGGDADTPLHGFGHAGTGGPGEWQSLLDNGTVRRSANTGASVDRHLTYRVRGRKPAGAPPSFSSYARGWDTSTGDAGEPRRSGSSSGARGGVEEFGDSTTLGSSWNSISATRLGLIFQSSGGNPAPTQVDILSMRVIDPWG